MSDQLVSIGRRQSRVPDLLFEDQREARIDEIRPLIDDPERVGPDMALHRITVFLTYRCNLACPYCKTIARSPAELLVRPQKAATFTLDAFTAMLDGHGATELRHLHFTGGEATTVRDMPAMIQRARERGVKQISVTTNGALAPSVYESLIDHGIDEVRVSLDAASAAAGDAMARRPGAWQRAVATIRALSARRQRGDRFCLIINTVISADNCDQVVDIVRFLLGLQPDDIKLITEVDTRGQLGASQGHIDALTDLLTPYPADAFPLLRRKIRTVFARDAIGLDRMGQQRDWRCYIPLTERTVDGEYYYPCSVYVREGGAPLGRIDEPEADKRRASAAFVRRGDCLDDPICQRYCLHCTAEYNRRVNEERDDDTQLVATGAV